MLFYYARPEMIGTEVTMCEDCLTDLALLSSVTDIEVKPEKVVERFL
jgi:hypothetical protein